MEIAILIFRGIDFFSHFKDQKKIYRNEWPPYSPRILYICLLGWAQVFAIIGILSLARTSRLLGPLRISLLKMLINVAQFFVIFCVFFFAFALGVTNLFQFTTFSKQNSTLCTNMENCTNDNRFPLSTIGSSALHLFWGLFNYFEVTFLTNGENSPFIKVFGIAMVGSFHIVIILILLNMLIAMMSKSYDKIDENKDIEWKFYQTEIWIRYIRNDFSKPPPMNLLVDLELITNLWKKTQNDPNSYPSIQKMLHMYMVDRSYPQDACKVYRKNVGQLDVAIKLLQRYKIKYLSKTTHQNHKKPS